MANVKDLIVNGATRIIGKVYAPEFVGKLTGNVTGDVSGNATSATKLETARSLKITDGTNTSTGVNFNGTTNVTLNLPTTIKATFSGNLTGNVTGNVSGSSGSCTGNAATASVINGTYTGNGGAQPPSYIGNGQVRFNMMNYFPGLSSLPNYADCILMDTYTGSDVPYVTGLGIIKADGNPRAFIAVGDKGNTTTWKSQAELITTANVASSHSHSYLPLSGGTLSNDAVISWANSGTWDVSSSPKGLIGGLSWSGQSDYISLRASENAADNLELILKFGDDNSNGLTIQNASEVKTARITAGGIIEANEFKGNLTGNASTATTATNLNYFKNTSTTSIELDSTDANGIGYVSGTNAILNQSDGALYRQVYSSSWVHEIYGDYRTGQIAVRGKNNNTWQAWRTILDSSNYTSWAASKTHDHSTDNITSGTLGTARGGTGLSSFTKGDIIYASADNTLSKLSKGTDGQVLKLSKGVPVWSTDNNSWRGIADNLTTDDDTVSLSARQGKVLNSKITDFDYRGRANTWSAVNTFSNGTDVTSGSGSASGAIIASQGGIWAAGGIRGNKVYNAIWNDLADCIPVDDDCELIPGYCYCFDGEKYYKSSKYLDDGIIGIHSDTYGMHMGYKDNCKQMDVAVAGFVLAYVDKEYPVGTPLTCTENGYLTKIEKSDKMEYPEKIVATYWKNESSEYWGGEKDKIKVNGRKWVKIK